jgi:hypothetical protein
LDTDYTYINHTDYINHGLYQPIEIFYEPKTKEPILKQFNAGITAITYWQSAVILDT